MPILLIVLSMLTTTAFLAIVLTTGRPEPHLHHTAVPRSRCTERIQGRILFVGRYAEHLVLDCVAGAGHPALCSLAPGTPFTLTVEPTGPPWFGDAVETMVARWAEEDAVVDFLVDGERVEVQGNRSRVRLDVRARAGLG